MSIVKNQKQSNREKLLTRIAEGKKVKPKYLFELENVIKTDIASRTTKVSTNKKEASDNIILAEANEDTNSEQKQFTETVQKIKELKLKNGQNSVVIGEILLEYKSKTSDERNFRNLLKHPDVSLKRTQADKLIKVSKFCTQSTEKVNSYIKLGIEKFAILIDAKLENKFESVANFVDEKNISVSQLKKLIGKIKEQPNMPIEGLFTELKEELKEARKVNKKSSNEQIDYAAECEKLKKYVAELEEELKLYKQKTAT